MLLVPGETNSHAPQRKGHSWDVLSPLCVCPQMSQLVLEKVHRQRVGKGHLRTEAVSVPGTDNHRTTQGGPRDMKRQQHLCDAFEEVAAELGLEEWQAPASGRWQRGGLSK